LDKAAVERIFANLQLREVRPAWTGSARRAPSDRPPVLTPAEVSQLNGDAPSTNGHGSENGAAHGTTADEDSWDPPSDEPLRQD